MKRALPALLLLLVCAGPASAQEAQTPAVTSKISFSLRYEWRRDRFAYRFEGPSSFNTDFLVPHVMEQTYRGDNQWVLFSARYHLFDSMAETEIGMTPHRRNTGMDYDTFFQPDANVVLYGTTADISLRGHHFAQRFVSRKAREDGSLSPWAMRVGYTFQRDQSVFYPSPSTTTQTMPPSFSSFWNPARETTVSSVHEFFFGTARDIRLSDTWQLVALADLTPLRIAKLLTLLPDKYPGEDLVFISKGFSLAWGVTAAHSWHSRRPSTVELSLGQYKTWNYRSDARLTRSSLSGGIAVRFSPM